MRVIDENNVLVQQNMEQDRMIGNVIVEHDSKNLKNSGEIISVGSNVKDVKAGDIVHFSDIAGVYVDKKRLRGLIILHITEIPIVSDSHDGIDVGEDHRLEIMSNVAAVSLNNQANH